MPIQNASKKLGDAALQRAFARFAGATDDASSGGAAVELAIIAPLLILMMISTVDLGMGFYRKMQVGEAAQAGAQYAMLNGFNSSKISTAITSATSFLGIAASPAPSQSCGCAASTGVTAASCGSQCPDTTVAGTYVTASAQATYNTILC
jgi:Flp pilus assembly protein TadG